MTSQKGTDDLMMKLTVVCSLATAFGGWTDARMRRVGCLPCMLILLCVMGGAGGQVNAAVVTWFGPSANSNSNATMATSTTYTSNFGVAFITGTESTYSMGWLSIGLNTSNVLTGTGSFQVQLRNTTDATAYSAVSGTTLYATDTISFTMPTSATTNFSVNLNPADFPNISSYVMSGTTPYSLIVNGASAAFGIQRTTGYANGTTNNFYTVSNGFVALDTFRNNTANYTNNTNSHPTLSIAFGTTVVPEPSTYAMALAGLGYGGFTMWRRRKRA
jgi:hypothetical protein